MNKDTELVDLDLSVRFLNILKAMKIKTLGQIIEILAPEGILKPFPKKVRGIGDAIYYEANEFLGKAGLLNSYEPGKFPDFAKSTSSRRMTDEEFTAISSVLEPHHELVSGLGFTEEIETTLGKMGWYSLRTTPVKNLVQCFVFIRPNSGKLVFKSKGQTGRQSSYDRRFRPLLPEDAEKAVEAVRKKLLELGYIKAEA